MISNIKSFMNLVYMPLVLFISIYAFCISIYSLKTKNKHDKYLYNINFNIYVMGIVVATFSLGFSLMISIKNYKTNSLFNILTLFITVIIASVLAILLKKFINLIKKEELREINKKKMSKELEIMLNDIY